MSVTPTTNGYAYTAGIGETEQQEIIEFIRSDLGACIGDGVQSYKNMMDKLIVSKSETMPLKTSSLIKFHEKNLDVIKNAVLPSYEDIIKNSTTDKNTQKKIEQLLEKAQETLEVLITKQLNEVYLRKLEVQMDNAVKKVKDCTSQAEMHYDEATLGDFELASKNRQELKAHHEKIAHGSLTRLNEILAKNEINNRDEFLSYELQWNLNERLEDMLQEVSDSNTTDEDEDQEQEAKPQAPEWVQNSSPGIEDIGDLKDVSVSELKKLFESEKNTVAKSNQTNRNSMENKNKQYTSSTTKTPVNGNVISQLATVKSFTSQQSTPVQPHHPSKSVSSPPTPTPPQKSEQKPTTTTSSRKNTIPPSPVIHGDPQFFIQNKSHASEPRMNVGIYFGKKSVRISTYNNDNDNLSGSKCSGIYKEIRCESPEIYFQPPAKRILIGKEANTYRHQSKGKNAGYFDIFNMVVQPTTSPSLSPCIEVPTKKGKTTNLCIHEIIAHFFRQVLKSVQKEYKAQIGTIVITIPVTPTSSIKERLRKSFQIAGYPDIHILSTVITTAVAVATTLEKSKSESIKSFANNKNLTKNGTPLYLFVVDYHKRYFSMGIVEITPTTICVINPHSSDNMSECQQEIFLQTHTNFYQNQKCSVANGYEDKIRKIYETAIKYVLQTDVIHPLEIHGVVVTEKKHGGSSLIEKIVGEIIGRKATHLKETSTNTKGSTLLGASLLALSISNEDTTVNSKHHRIENGYNNNVGLPRRINVHDTSCCKLLLSIFDSNAKHLLTQKFNMGPLLMNDFVFVQKFQLPPDFKSNRRNFLFIQLYEHLRLGSESDTTKACGYKVMLRRPDTANLSLPVGIRCHVDTDGILSLAPAEEDPTSEALNEIIMMRVDYLKCSKACKRTTSSRSVGKNN